MSQSNHPTTHPIPQDGSDYDRETAAMRQADKGWNESTDLNPIRGQSREAQRQRGIPADS
jgi:hypothetical protein